LIREESKNSQSNPFSNKKRSQEKGNQIGRRKIHNINNTNIDYFYNSGIDYLSKCFLEIEKENENFSFFINRIEEEK
jgi:hypothetical protein